MLTQVYITIWHLWATMSSDNLQALTSLQESNRSRVRMGVNMPSPFCYFFSLVFQNYQKNGNEIWCSHLTSETYQTWKLFKESTKCKYRNIVYEEIEEESFSKLPARKVSDREGEYRQTSNIIPTCRSRRCSWSIACRRCSTTSSFSTWHLASMDWAKTTSRWDQKHLSFGF